MRKALIWPKKLSNGFLHEKVVFFSLLFLLIVLSLDCFFHNLPISGYGLVLTSLLLIGCTTCSTCHGIKWILTSNRPITFHFSEKSKNEKWIELVKKNEDKIFRKIFSNENSFESFKYPTSLNEQTRLLIKDIEKDFVKTWYSEISQNPSFLFDSHLILEEIFFKIIKKLKTINCKNIILSILILYLNHLQDYKKTVKKWVRLGNEDETKPKVELENLCKYSHPGSQSDQILNYYLKKVSKTVLKEFAPHEFAISLECKILSGIIARKVFRKLIMTVEDPNWINIKLIYLMNAEKHKKLLENGIYCVKEKPIVVEEEFQFKKPAMLSKRFLSGSLFDSSRNLFERNGLQNENGSKPTENVENTKPVEKTSLTLPLHSIKTNTDEAKGNISTVLSGLISSTAGPLLPDNISVRYQALNKMWQSPVAEVKDISESITNSFKKVFFDGPKEKKGLTRSKSTETLAENAGSLKTKDISVGEELCEAIKFNSEDSSKSIMPKVIKKLTKTRSFDSDSLVLDDMNDGDVTGPQKNSPSPEHQRDVSPVYEEPEDFATTIAKLRSVLQQRESNSTLSDKSNLSVDSQSIGYSMDRSDSSNKSQSMENDSFDSQMACDIPTDGRLFINVSIPKGELITDSSGAVYVLYSIQYDGIYMLKDEQNPNAETDLVLQTTVVKRRFQEFLHLQARLEENSNYKNLMKGIKGPSKWLSVPFNNKPDESTTSSRRIILETFLKQLCSKTEFSNSPELHEFLAYGHSGNGEFVKKNSESSLQRIDKLLANKVTGVFNSIKTVLPSFDFDSSALIATNDTVKGFQDQKLLQGFLNFGNKPECYELNLNFSIKEPTGDSLTDDIRHYFSEKSDCIEDAVDVLDSNDWLSEQKECRFISAEEKCVWHGYKDVVLDDELEPLDSWLPVYSLLLDILCELLQESDSWAIKEPVIRLLKVLSGHWEKKVQEEMSKMDWDRIFGNVIRLLRGVIFQSEGGEVLELNQEETKKALKEIIINLMPVRMSEFVTVDGISSAVSLFVDSFQHFRLNRDVLLRLLDIILVHLLSCHHLIPDTSSPQNGNVREQLVYQHLLTKIYHPLQGVQKLQHHVKQNLPLP